jgi:hypothetical protein
MTVRKFRLCLISLVIVFVQIGELVSAEMVVSAEGGAVFTGYNNARIPGDSGNKFSLHNELETDVTFGGRLEPELLLGRHSIRLLVAPLRLESEGYLEKDVYFAGRNFYAGVPTQALFRFDSYRMTWSYYLSGSGMFRLALGVTGKVRDAEITLQQGDVEASKKNTGFVPLIHFDAELVPSTMFSLRVRGDALAAPQGRAEDVLCALYVNPFEKVRFYAGYRILEGGADNTEVYTFSLFHYAVAGLEFRW